MSSEVAAQTSAIASAILGIIAEVAGDGSNAPITADSPLIGSDAIVKSRQLVEILLAVEEYADEKLGVAFNWSSDAAMSQRRSVFRTPASLAEHLASLAAQGGNKS
jgi:acyl carrier protein